MNSVAGFISVALLTVLATMWCGMDEPKMPSSDVVRVVTQGITASGGALVLGYGWKGTSAIYHADGMNAGTYSVLH
jgi:hypothetical protein